MRVDGGDVAGDVMGKAGVGVGVAVAVGDGDKPARAGDERGHFAGGGVEVNRGAGGGFDRVGQAPGLGLLKGERAVAGRLVFAGGKDIHGSAECESAPHPPVGGEGGRCGFNPRPAKVP